MNEHTTQFKVICLETEAFYSLVEQVTKRIQKDKASSRKERWVDDKEAMQVLKITSKTTLQKYRNEGQIRYSQIGKKVILYDRQSLERFIERNAKNEF